MLYEILNYQKYKQRMNKLLHEDYINPITKEPSLAITRFGFPVDHYTIGYGPNHFVFVGGTHGNELISVDFVTQLMHCVASQSVEFAQFDESKYTFHFIPLHNPEGFIINSATVHSRLPKTNQEIEAFAHRYYRAYRQDDILAKTIKPKLPYKFHQQIFSTATEKTLTEYPSLATAIAKYTHSLPKGSLIDWRANASGIDLNGNSPHHRTALKLQKENKYAQGRMRFNNLPDYTFGPLGAATLDAYKFGYEPENESLLNLIDKLYLEKQYSGLITFHSSGGMVFYNPYPEFLSINNQEEPNIAREITAHINSQLADIYSKLTNYKKTYSESFACVDDLLRANVPGVLLIELSKMGGNPIGPYGSYKNYQRVIQDNLLAVSAYTRYALALKEDMYPAHQPKSLLL